MKTIKNKFQEVKTFIKENKKMVAITSTILFVMITAIIIVSGIFNQPKNVTENVNANPKTENVTKENEKVTETKVETKTEDVNANKEEQKNLNNDVNANQNNENVTTENVTTNPTTEKVTENKPVENKPTVTETKAKSCRIVRTPAKYKTVHHPEKYRMEPIMEQRSASCVFMPDGSEVVINGWSDEKLESFMIEHRVGRTGTCTNLPNVKVGEIKIVEQEAWTEEVEISPAKEETICE